MKIGVISILPWKNKFLGINCAKGRGILLPGGKFEPKDNTFLGTAIRETREEVGVEIDYNSCQYVCCIPNTDGFMVYSFWCPDWIGKPKEGKPVLAEWIDLLSNKHRAYYSILYDIMKGKYRYET